MNDISRKQMICVWILLVGGLATSCTLRNKPALIKPSTTQGDKWEWIKSVPDTFGGQIDFVAVPPANIRDLTNYQVAADTIAGNRDKCMIFFWTNRAQIPNAANIPVTTLRVMTATYERYPTYKAPHLRLAAWLYPTSEEAKQAKAFFMP